MTTQFYSVRKKNECDLELKWEYSLNVAEIQQFKLVHEYFLCWFLIGQFESSHHKRIFQIASTYVARVAFNDYRVLFADKSWHRL